MIEHMSEEYIVRHINQEEQVLTIVDADVFSTGCPRDEKLVNTTFDRALFDFAP